MSDKKHIDRLFQEKLKNFEAAPSEAVWDKIHDRLHPEKRKRRIIPIWWKLAGVAALLALLFTVGINFMSNNTTSGIKNPMVDTETPTQDISDDLLNSNIESSNDFQNDVDTSDKVAIESESNSEERQKNNSNKITSTKPENNQIQKKGSNNNSAIVNNENSEANNNRSHENSISNRSDNRTENLNKNTSSQNIVNDISKIKNNNNNNNNNNLNRPENNKRTSEIDKLIKDSNTRIAETSAAQKIENIVSEEKKEEVKKEDKSIEDAIAEASLAEEKDDEETKLNRWNITPNVAPVFFNTLGKGSTLDAQFVENSNSSEVTMSYGLGGSYAINDRLKVRAGINKVDMGYSTNNVIAYKSITTDNSQARSQLSNVNVNEGAENITFLSTQTLNRNSTPEIINTQSQGVINQRFGFIEVPLEMEYALINKKVGVNVIGGFSTLIADKNEIYSVSNGNETRIGEANNINNMSYSANIGFGINYNISQKIKVNVEPTFKYQMNTFNDSSGDFQPYFIGVYTGLSYKF